MIFTHSYKTMYLELFNAFTDAINILTEAQRKCEEHFINGKDALIPLPRDEKEDGAD